MQVTFVLANYHSARMDMIHCELCSSVSCRSVTIELTPEQVQQIGIKQVGTDRRTPIFEEIHQVFVERPT